MHFSNHTKDTLLTFSQGKYAKNYERKKETEKRQFFRKGRMGG